MRVALYKIQRHKNKIQRRKKTDVHFDEDEKKTGTNHKQH